MYVACCILGHTPGRVAMPCAYACTRRHLCGTADAISPKSLHIYAGTTAHLRLEQRTSVKTSRASKPFPEKRQCTGRQRMWMTCRDLRKTRPRTDLGSTNRASVDEVVGGKDRGVGCAIARVGDDGEDGADGADMVADPAAGGDTSYFRFVDGAVGGLKGRFTGDRSLLFEQ